MGRRKTSTLKEYVEIDLCIIIDSVYLDILTLIASGKAKYTKKIAEILGKKPSTISGDIKNLLRLSLLRRGRRTKAQEYEIEWNRLTKMILEHWERIAFVHSEKRENKEFKKLFSHRLEKIGKTSSMKQLIKHYFCRYSQIKQRGGAVLVPAYGVFFSKDNILTLSMQMLIDFTCFGTIKKMKKCFIKENKKVYKFFKFFKEEVLDITSIYEKSTMYAIRRLIKQTG